MVAAAAPLLEVPPDTSAEHLGEDLAELGEEQVLVLKGLVKGQLTISSLHHLKTFVCSTSLPLDGFNQHFQATVHFPLSSAVD